MYNSLLEKLILPFVSLFTKDSFLNELKILRSQMNLTESELAALQKQKLAQLLKHAFTHSSFYQTRISKVDQVDPYEILRNMPVLEKQEIRDYTDALLTKKRDSLLKNSSSGSSGFQTSVYWSFKEQAINRATQMLWWEWAGYRFGDPLIQTGINPHRPGIKKLKDIFFRTKYISAFSHSEEEVLRCFSSIRGRKNYTLAGYASSLYVMATIAKKNNLQVHFKNAVCWGDKLFEHYRKTIDSEFGCCVHETYGSAEGLMMGAQKDLPYMYIMSPNVVIEILDDYGNEVADGEMGHVVVTNLNAYAMPLIRYRIGDLAIKLPKKNYPSNRMLNLPVLQKVIGRDTDLIKTSSGKYMVVHSFTGIFEHVPEIEQFCVIQNVLSGIIIEFVPGKNFTQKCLELVKEKILSELNESFDIEFKAVEFIVASKSGKPQIIISNIK